METVYTIHLIPLELFGNNFQLRELKEHVFMEDIEWVSLGKEKETKGMFLKNPLTIW
jgi:hypothetical protein